jgi:hypothetical protein
MEFGNFDVRERALAVALAGTLALSLASCTTDHHEPVSPTQPPVSRQIETSPTPAISQPTATETQTPETTAPSATASPSREDCNSIRAVFTGQYFSKHYEQDGHNISRQLDLLSAAFSKGSNIDVDHDSITYVEMVHAAENDPQMAQALIEAINIYKQTLPEDPKFHLSVKEFLALPVDTTPTCAPRRISDADSKLQLQLTGIIAHEVGTALAGHLKDQGVRASVNFYRATKRHAEKYGPEVWQQIKQSFASLVGN